MEDNPLAQAVVGIIGIFIMWLFNPVVIQQTIAIYLIVCILVVVWGILNNL